VVICIRTAPLNVIRLRRSLYGTSMPGAGAVHHINKRSALRQSGAKAYGLDSDFGERI